MRDLMNSFNVIRAISPVATAADNTPVVSQIIDRQGYDSITFVIATGALPDADATFAVTMDHGDVSNLSDAVAVPAAELVGTYALAGFIFSDDDKTRKIGYNGSKRYTRLTITPAANSSASLLAAVAILGHPTLAPTTNPPA